MVSKLASYHVGEVVKEDDRRKPSSIALAIAAEIALAAKKSDLQLIFLNQNFKLFFRPPKIPN